MIDFDMSSATVAEETSEPASASQDMEDPSTSSSFSSTPAGSQFGEKGERVRSASVRRAPVSDPLAQHNKTVLI